MAPHLLDFCSEILHNILIEVSPADLAALSKSCRSLHEYIENNELLWAGIAFRHFDQPVEHSLCSQDLSHISWIAELKRRVWLQKLLTSQDRSYKEQHFVQASKSIIQILQQAKSGDTFSLNKHFLMNHFEDQLNLDTFLFSSSLYKHCGSAEQTPHPDPEARRLSAQLHSLFGVCKEPLGRTRARAAQPVARSQVYDIRNYNDQNLWGPFTSDGCLSVDWEKVETLMIVLGHLMERYQHRCTAGLAAFNNPWDKPFNGSTPRSFVSSGKLRSLLQYLPIEIGPENDVLTPAQVYAQLLPQPDLSLEARDPYGISGSWRRVVAFLDYSEFYDFNNLDNEQGLGQNTAGSFEPRPPLHAQEAVRFITMKIRVTDIQEPGEDDGKELPVVNFRGFSRSMHSGWDANANSRIVGSVRLTKGGDVRWTTLSIFRGEARWRSEGIQVGGLRSARGVIGNWFDKDFDPHGPVGPTAFWKLSDEVDNDVAMLDLPVEFE